MEYCLENTGRSIFRAMLEVRYRLNRKRIWPWVGVYTLLGAYFLRIYLFTSVVCFRAAVFFAVQPYLVLRKGWKKELAFHNDAMPVNTAKIGENIRFENAMASRMWEYHHMEAVYSFKYSYCLKFTDQTVLLGRENFNKGTFAECKQFLRAKRPDLKIPE